MENKKIKPLLNFNDNRLSKKFKKFGISKKEADELAFHFVEIERFCLGFRESIINILKIKNNEKKNIEEELDYILGELETHIIKNHFIPTKKILDKNLNK